MFSTRVSASRREIAATTPLRRVAFRSQDDRLRNADAFGLPQLSEQGA